MGLGFIVFLLTPIVEMYLLIEIGGIIGTLPTIGLVVFTALAGVVLLRLQGFATLARGVGRLNRGELPLKEVAEGLLLAVAGALLLTPGFVTDSAGFALLLPPVRQALARWLLRRVEIRMPPGSGGPGPYDDGPPGPGGDRGPVVIEGDYEERPGRDPRSR